MSRTLVTIGACATAGGVQALRNFADVDEFTSVVYARPDYISTLATSTPIAAHVDVDFELHGCPIDRRQLLEVITALLVGPQAEHPGPQRVLRVQAARQRVRGGRARHAVPRTGDARRVRCAVPGPPSRLLRLFRPDGDTQRGRPGRACCGPPAWSRPTSCGHSARSTPAHPRSSSCPGSPSDRHRRRPASDVSHRTPTARSTCARWPGSRAKARCTSGCAAAPSRTYGWRSTSRPGSSRRSCAGGGTPNRPTSPLASAGSARSRTR